MGAYRYIQPRLATAMRELSMAAFGVPPRALHYIGRPAAASAGARNAFPRPACEFCISQAPLLKQFAHPLLMCHAANVGCAATASNAIHLEETKEILDAALRGGRLSP